MNVSLPQRAAGLSQRFFFLLISIIYVAERCVSSAQILTEIRSKVDHFIPEGEKQACADCISEFQQVAGQLRSLVYRSMCPILINQAQVSLSYVLYF